MLLLLGRVRTCARLRLTDSLLECVCRPVVTRAPRQQLIAKADEITALKVRGLCAGLTAAGVTCGYMCRSAAQGELDAAQRGRAAAEASATTASGARLPHRGVVRSVFVQRVSV